MPRRDNPWWSQFRTIETFSMFGVCHANLQARVQVPNPPSQQAPNPDPKIRPSLKNEKTPKPNSLDWADTIVTWLNMI